MRPLAFGRFTDEILALYAPPLRAQATRDKLAQALVELEDAGARSTADLAPPVIARWLALYAHRAPATNHSLLRSIRAASRYARMRGYLDADPFEWRSPADWLGPDATRGEPVDRHLTRDQVAALLQLADLEAAAGDWPAGRRRALVYTLAFTGLRKREALGLLVADVDLPTGVLRIRPNARRTLKTRGSAAPVGLAEPLAAVLAQWSPLTGAAWLFPGVTRRGPWLQGGPGVRALDQLRALGERAGIPGVTFQTFRQTLATLSEGWGVGELELQRWLRHTRPRTQDAYRRADLDVLRSTALKIRFA
jgi:integrase